MQNFLILKKTLHYFFLCKKNQKKKFNRKIIMKKFFILYFFQRYFYFDKTENFFVFLFPCLKHAFYFFKNFLVLAKNFDKNCNINQIIMKVSLFFFNVAKFKKFKYNIGEGEKKVVIIFQEDRDKKAFLVKLRNRKKSSKEFYEINFKEKIYLIWQKNKMKKKILKIKIENLQKKFLNIIKKIILKKKMVGIFTQNISIFNKSKKFLDLKGLNHINREDEDFKKKIIKILRFSNSKKNSFFFFSFQKTFLNLIQKKLDKREFLFHIELNHDFIMKLIF
jgi:hypothetical protein